MNVNNTQQKNTAAPVVICALYHFFSFADFKDWREPLLALMHKKAIHGSLLLAKEGINGTVAGSREAIDELLAYLQADERLAALDWKESFDQENPFLRAKVKLKKEIVTMGVAEIDPTKAVGIYLDAQAWNELISDPDTLLIDARNDYEYEVGSFKGAVNPNTRSFREFPEYLDKTLGEDKQQKVAMFCTGGIRCEKATAYLRDKGFDQVYHLQGGILRYLETMPEQETLWQGECFVFDERVTVNHQLEQGQYDQCHACRRPISKADQQAAHFELGVSCPHCYAHTSEQQKQRFRQRQKQIELARERGEKHRGQNAPKVS